MSDDNMITIWLQGFVKNFKFAAYDKTLEANILGMMEGMQVEMMIRAKRKGTSAQTHSYYRGVVLPTALQSEVFRGWKLADIHKYFTSKHLKDVIERQMGEVTVMIVNTKSTADISQKSMNKYIQDVIQELAELGIQVPEAKINK